MKRGWMVNISDKLSFKGLSDIMLRFCLVHLLSFKGPSSIMLRFCLVWLLNCIQLLSELIWKPLLLSRRDLQSFFFIRRCCDENRDVPSWHFVLISDRDLWLPSRVTLPLWTSRCPHFRVDWAHAADTIVYRFPGPIQFCISSVCPYNWTGLGNCIWFKSNNDTGVRSLYNCA